MLTDLYVEQKLLQSRDGEPAFMTTEDFGMTLCKYKRLGPTRLIRAYLPDFCWQTTFEIMRMLEQYDIESTITYDSVKCVISHLVADGLVLRRRLPKRLIPSTRRTLEASQVPPTFEYRRNPKWSRECLKKH